MDLIEVENTIKQTITRDNIRHKDKIQAQQQFNNCLLWLKDNTTINELSYYWFYRFLSYNHKHYLRLQRLLKNAVKNHIINYNAINKYYYFNNNLILISDDIKNNNKHRQIGFINRYGYYNIDTYYLKYKDCNYSNINNNNDLLNNKTFWLFNLF